MENSKTILTREERIRRAKLAKIKKSQEEAIKKKSIEEDIKYVTEEVLAKQKNGKYCKFSRVTKSVTATNLTKYKYLTYWLANLNNKRASDEQLDDLVSIIVDKFNKDLLPLEDMIELELESKDIQKEKDRIIQEITEEN